MRKLIVSIISLASLLGIIGTPQSSAFDKGEKSLGVEGGYASYNNSGYMGINFQYSIKNHFRLAPDIVYIFSKENKSGFAVDVDMQFPFRLAKGFGIYPVAGITFNNWIITDPIDNSKDNYARFGGNFGAGFDIYITSDLKISVEGKYSLMKDTSGFFAGGTISYIF